MATTINTRIALKSDLSANWENSTLVALKGEYLFDSQRGYIKVGDGAKTWKELPTIRLPKTAIDGLQDVNSNTIYEFSPESGNTIKLLSADGTLENPVFDSENPVSTFKIDLSSEISAIADAYRAIEEARATGIEATLTQAIADNTAAIGAEVERATAAEAELRADVNSISTNYATKVEVEDVSVALSTDYVEKIGEAVEDAKEYIDDISASLSTTIKADYVKYDDVNGGKAAVTEDNKIATIADIIGLSGVVHFRGASETFDGTTAKPTDIEWYNDHEPQDGDIVINSKTSKEYLFANKKWLELGDEGLYVKKSFELNGHQLSGNSLDLAGSDITVGGIYSGKSVDEALDQVSADAEAYTDEQIAALDVAEVTVGESKTIASISETDGKISVVTADIKIAESQVTGLDAHFETLSGMVEAEEEAREAADADLQDQIDSISGGYVTKEEAAALSTALSTDYVEKIGEALEDANDYTDQVSAALSTDLGTLIANEKARAEGVEGGLRADINTVSADLDALEADAIKGIKLNNADFDIANNAATLDISAIICGGAE